MNLAAEVIASYRYWFSHPIGEFMARRGVTDAARISAGNCGMLEIDPLAGGMYQPSPGAGRWALVMPIYSSVRPPCVQPADIQPVDIVAWLPKRPDRWWLRKGATTILGEWAIEVADATNEPLIMIETPFGWLKAGGGGAVILDDDARHALRGLEFIAMGGPRHAAELDRRLAPPVPAPVIYLPQDAAE